MLSPEDEEKNKDVSSLFFYFTLYWMELDKARKKGIQVGKEAKLLAYDNLIWGKF